jgi:NAD(P)H dehydrogenase (quinone)
VFPSSYPSRSRATRTTRLIVGLDYGHAGQMTLDEITGGSPYGATTTAGGDGSRMPTANELVGARYQGRKIAEIANKLHG